MGCLTPQRDPVFILFVVLKTVWFSCKDMGGFHGLTLNGNAQEDAFALWDHSMALGAPIYQRKDKRMHLFWKNKNTWKQSFHTSRAKGKCADETVLFSLR